MNDTLETARAGRPVRVSEIQGGHEVRSRLARFGLLPGVVLQVLVRGPLGGPVLVEVGATRFALGRGLARHVRVEP